MRGAGGNCVASRGVRPRPLNELERPPHHRRQTRALQAPHLDVSYVSAVAGGDRGVRGQTNSCRDSVEKLSNVLPEVVAVLVVTHFSPMFILFFLKLKLFFLLK